MNPGKILSLSALAVCAALCGCERQVSFANDVQPILDSACVNCHDQSGEGAATSGLALNSYNDLMQGTRFGQVVVPGSPESSALYLTVAQKTAPEIHMPPHHDDRLAKGQGVPLRDDQVETIRRWIEQGAKNN